MIRARVVASDRPKDSDELYIIVERDGAQILRVTSLEAKSLTENLRVDERVRSVVKAVTVGIMEIA